MAVVAAVVCYWVSCLLVGPERDPRGFGIDWQAMSPDPLALVGQFPHRLLAPTLAHVLGFVGADYILFARGLGMLLLATVFWFCRRQGAAVVDAALVTLAIAVTAAIQMYKQHWVGYPDALCYALFFWAWLNARRPLLCWGLVLANLFNHELAVFLLPWLWFVRRRANGSWRLDAVAVAIVLGLYGAFYLWVKSHAPAQAYSYEYFAKHPLFPGGTFVVVCLALVHFVVAFGPVIVVLAWHQRRPELARERPHLWLVLAGVLVIFCIAFDWARHANLVVLPLVLASVRFLAAGHRAVYAALVALGALLMWLVPPWSPSAWPTHELADMKLWLDVGVVVRENDDYFPGTLRSALGGWLPAIWPLLASCLGILAAIWLAGALFARWRPAPPARATADRAA